MSFWCDEQIVVQIDGPEGPREVVVPARWLASAPIPQSEIVLSGPGVAKRAIYLHATPEGIFALGLDVENAADQPRGRWLSADEPLLVGPYRLTARLASSQDASPPAGDLTALGSAEMPIPVVNIYCGQLLKDKRRFRSALSLLGRRPQCALRLRGLKVSSFHCVLYWHQQRLWCVDLLSSNGTFLNGERFDCGEIGLNDRLEVGEFGIVYYRSSPRSGVAASVESARLFWKDRHRRPSKPLSRGTKSGKRCWTRWPSKHEQIELLQSKLALAAADEAGADEAGTRTRQARQGRREEDGAAGAVDFLSPADSGASDVGLSAANPLVDAGSRLSSLSELNRAAPDAIGEADNAPSDSGNANGRSGEDERRWGNAPGQRTDCSAAGRLRPRRADDAGQQSAD